MGKKAQRLPIPDRPTIVKAMAVRRICSQSKLSNHLALKICSFLPTSPRWPRRMRTKKCSTQIERFEQTFQTRHRILQNPRDSCVWYIVLCGPSFKGRGSSPLQIDFDHECET